MRPDKLIVSGLGVLDGQYDFDLIDLLALGTPESLTYRELHLIKEYTETANSPGVRAGELHEAFEAGDSDLNLAIMAIIMTRAGKRVDRDVLMDAPGTTEMRFVIGERKPEEADADVPPASGRPVNGETGTPSSNGGGESGMTSESLAVVPSLTGGLGSATFVPVTSES